MNGLLHLQVLDLVSGQTGLIAVPKAELKGLVQLANNGDTETKLSKHLVGMSLTTSKAAIQPENLEIPLFAPIKLLRISGLPAPIFQDAKKEPQSVKKALGLLGTEDLKAIGLACDYAWRTEQGRLCIVERKDVDDLISSIADGRLRTEMADGKEIKADIVFILVEGWMGRSKNGKPETHRSKRAHYPQPRTYAQIWATIATFQAFYPNVIVWPSPGIYATPSVLVDMYNWSNDTKHSSIQESALDLGYATKLSKEEVILLGLPGVGPELAIRLYEAFGSPIAAMTGGVITEIPEESIKGMRRVRGIGKKISTNTKLFLEGKMSHETAQWEIDVENIVKEIRGEREQA